MAPSIAFNSSLHRSTGMEGAVYGSGCASQPRAVTCARADLSDGGLPRAPTRVPSLVFDIELEDGGIPCSGSDGEGTAGVRELSNWLLAHSTGELHLRTDVDAALRSWATLRKAEGPPPAAGALEAVAKALALRGWTVSLRTALGGGDGTDCLRNLRHAFLMVLPPGAHATTNKFVVDLAFKEQFRIAKPTPRYQALLDCLPEVYVANEAAVAPLVNFMCQEMAAAFRASGTVLPPWRATASMLSKWIPRKSMDERVHARHGMAAAAAPVVDGVAPLRGMPSSMGALMAKRSLAPPAAAAQGMWMPLPTGLPLNKAAAAAAAAPTRPPTVACEPQRVVVGGNFSAIGFP